VTSLEQVQLTLLSVLYMVCALHTTKRSKTWNFTTNVKLQI